MKENEKVNMAKNIKKYNETEEKMKVDKFDKNNEEVDNVETEGVDEKCLLDNKKKFCGIVVVTLVVIALISYIVVCIIEDKAKRGIKLSEFEKMAEDYYEEKYGSQLLIKDSGSTGVIGVINSENGDMYIENSKDNSIIIYKEEKRGIYDNKEAKKIITNIEETVLKEISDKIIEETVADEIIYENLKLNAYDINLVEGLNGSYFNSKYNGDIKDYLEKEQVIINEVLMFVVCEDNEVTNEQSETICKSIIEEIKSAGFYYDESYIKVHVLTKGCYDRYVNGECRLPDIDMKECFAKYELGKNEYKYIPNYIEVTDGVYITSVEKNFQLEEGDIILNKLENDSAIKELLANRNESEEDTKQYIIGRNSCVYNLEFSDRVKEYLEKKRFKELNVYVRYDLEKAEITEDTIMLTKEVMDVDKTEYNSENDLGEDSISKDKSDENTESKSKQIKLYYYRKEFGSKCFDLYTEMSEGEYGVLRENDYMFFGVQEGK